MLRHAIEAMGAGGVVLLASGPEAGTHGSFAATFAAWLACLAFAAMLFNHLAKLSDNLRGRSRERVIQPQPLEVKEAEAFATERACQVRHNLAMGEIATVKAERAAEKAADTESRRRIYEKFEGLRAEMGAMERRLEASDEERSVKLHDRINVILEAVGELRGKVSS